MSSFHVHARLFEGTLADPIRNELQSAESDDRDEVMRLAEALAARGFAVWVYEHRHASHGVEHGAYRVIAELRGDKEKRPAE